MLLLRAGTPKLRIDELAFTSNGTGLLAPALSAGLCYWPSLTTDAKSEVLSPPAKVVKRIAVAPDGRTLLAGNDQLCVFDLGSRSGPLVNVPKWASLWFGLSPDGGRVVVAEAPQGSSGSRLTLWATDSLDSPAREISTPTLVYSAPQFLPGGDRFLFLEGEQQPERKWVYRRVTRSASNGEVADRSDPLPDDPDQMVLSPDGRTVACRTRNAVRLYPAGGRGEGPVIANEGKQHFTGIAFHPSGELLAATSNDKTVKLYHTATGQVSTVFTWDIGRTRSVAFSPDGTLAAAGSDTGKVVVWDVDF